MIITNVFFLENNAVLGTENNKHSKRQKEAVSDENVKKMIILDVPQ